MNKKTTLPLEATAAYDPKNDAVVLTSADKKLNGSRFRVALRKGTVEDLKLRELFTEASRNASQHQTEPELPSVPAAPAPAPLEGLEGKLPFGIGVDEQPVLWNPDRYPNALIIADDAALRSQVTQMLRAVIEHQDDWRLQLLDDSYTQDAFSSLEQDISSRYSKMRKEGVTWYTDVAAENLQRRFLFVEAADSLKESDERLLHRIVTLGPAAGVQVIAIAAAFPEWKKNLLGGFKWKAVAEDWEPGSRSLAVEALTPHYRGPSIAGDCDLLVKKGSRPELTPARLHSMPR